MKNNKIERRILSSYLTIMGTAIEINMQNIYYQALVNSRHT